MKKILLTLLLFFTACSKQTVEENTSESISSGASTDARAQAYELRALSFAMRDEAPSIEEAKAYLAGQSNKSSLITEWQGDARFQTRVGRHFNDSFGFHPYPEVIYGTRALVKDANGWYQSGDGYPQCTSVSQIQNYEAWWGEKGNSTPICSLSDCGPYALRCGLIEHRGALMDAIRYEFQDRALYVYNQGLSWSDLYAGTFFYGSRLLLHKYIYDSGVAEDYNPAKASASEARTLADQLFALPILEKTRANYPSVGPKRYGLLGMPVFLQRFNNFRSRTRALTQNLHCRDIGSWMNPTAMTDFVNKTSLTSFDLSHGSKTDCASCHLGMDNWGSTLLGWGDQGQWQWWKQWTQTGAVFGVEGSGEQFLISQILSKEDLFLPCMAQKVWRSFSQGKSWESLSSSEQGILNSAASQGPRSLILSVFSLDSLSGTPDEE